MFPYANVLAHRLASLRSVLCFFSPDDFAIVEGAIITQFIPFDSI